MQTIKKIPIRILVNGTRGKTTTVQIIYNILRNSGYEVFAKTTGDQAIQYYPDDQQKIIKRFSPASIIENFKILHKWSKYNPEAIVLECMALHPENQFVLSKKMLKPTHILITNIYQDHLEVMGDNIYDISESISECFYKNAKIILSGKQKFAKNRGYDLTVIENKSFKNNYTNIPQAIINESWGLIAELSNILKINSSIAENEFHNIWNSKNKNLKIENKNLNFEFWNLFSVNDYESSKKFIEFIIARKNENHNCELIFNTRMDRPLRTKLFISLITSYFKDSKIFVIGNGKSLAYKLLTKSGCKYSQIEKKSYIIANFRKGFESKTTVLGLGNFKGIEPFLEYINKGELQ